MRLGKPSRVQDGATAKHPARRGELPGTPAQDLRQSKTPCTVCHGMHTQHARAHRCPRPAAGPLGCPPAAVRQAAAAGPGLLLQQGGQAACPQRLACAWAGTHRGPRQGLWAARPPRQAAGCRRRCCCCRVRVLPRRWCRQATAACDLRSPRGLTIIPARHPTQACRPHAAMPCHAGPSAPPPPTQRRALPCSPPPSPGVVSGVVATFAACSCRWRGRRGYRLRERRCRRRVLLKVRQGLCGEGGRGSSVCSGECGWIHRRPSAAAHDSRTCAPRRRLARPLTHVHARAHADLLRSHPPGARPWQPAALRKGGCCGVVMMVERNAKEGEGRLAWQQGTWDAAQRLGCQMYAYAFCGEGRGKS